MTVAGEDVNSTITRENNKLVFQGAGINVNVSALDDGGNQIALDKDGNLRVDAGNQIVVEATGFDANQTVESWLFSTPNLLGTETATLAGAINARYDVPAGVDPGSHRLVLRAKTADGSDSVISIGLIFGEPDSGSVNISLIVGIVLGLAVLVALILPVAIRRRKDAAA